MVRNNDYLNGNKFAKGNKPNITSFKKGFIPWNKNIKGLHFSPKTEFKKGQKGINWKPIGAISQRNTKGKVKREFIKIQEPNKWLELSLHLWLLNYGKILKGDVIHHIDGNRLNNKIENLIALPRKDHPIFHNRWGLKILSENQIKYYIERYK